MPSPLEHVDAATFFGSWPLVPYFSGATPAVIPGALLDRATLLGARRESSAGFNVSGRSFKIWIDAVGPIPVTFTGTNPLDLDDVISQINSGVSGGYGQDVAFRDNGYLRLRSATVGGTSYLKIDTDPASSPADVFFELGLYAGIESRGGTLTPSPTVDPDRQAALPGQYSVSYGEDLDYNAINRAVCQLAVNVDHAYGQFRRGMAKTVSQDIAISSDEFQLAGDHVYCGKIAGGSIQDDTAIVLDTSDNEVVTERDLDLQTSLALDFYYNSDEQKQYVEATAATPFTAGDAAGDYYVVVTPGGSFGALEKMKIIEFVSTSVVVVANIVEADGTEVEVGTPSSHVSITNGIRRRTYTEPLKITDFLDGPGGSSIIDTASEIVAATAISRVERNNRIVCDSASFTNVKEGDVAVIAGHDTAVPFSNNGSYRVSKIIDTKTLELMSIDHGPIVLNTLGSFGTVTIQTDTNFYYAPYVKLSFAPPSGTYRVVYKKYASLLEMVDDVDSFATSPTRFVQETSYDIQKVVKAIIGPSATSFNEYLYDDKRNSLENLYFRMNQEHNADGRHTTIRPDEAQVGGITGTLIGFWGPTVGHSEIDALLLGSDSGTLIEGKRDTHLVMGIRDNQVDDTFSIVSGGGNFHTDSLYDTLVARFQADGQVYLPGQVGIGNVPELNSQLFSYRNIPNGGSGQAIYALANITDYAGTVQSVYGLTNVDSGADSPEDIVALRGAYFLVNKVSGSTANIITSVIGVHSWNQLLGSGTISNVYNFMGQGQVGDHTITGSWRGLYLLPPSVAGGSLNTYYGIYLGDSNIGDVNNYGIYIHGASGGSGNNYSIFVNSGASYFNGDVIINATRKLSFLESGVGGGHWSFELDAVNDLHVAFGGVDKIIFDGTGSAGNLHPASGATGALGTETYPWYNIYGYRLQVGPNNDADLFRVTRNSGTYKSGFLSGGSFRIRTTESTFDVGFGPLVSFYSETNNGAISYQTAALGGASRAGSGGAGGELHFFTVSASNVLTARALFDSAGNFQPYLHDTHYLGLSTTRWRTTYTSRLSVGTSGDDSTFSAYIVATDDGFGNGGVVRNQYSLSGGGSSGSKYGLSAIIDSALTGTQSGEIRNIMSTVRIGTGSTAAITALKSFSSWILNSGTPAGNITSYYGFHSTSTITGFGVSNLYNFYATNAGGTGTVGAQYGLRVDPLSGATSNNIGVRVDGVPSGSGDYSIYAPAGRSYLGFVHGETDNQYTLMIKHQPSGAGSGSHEALYLESTSEYTTNHTGTLAGLISALEKSETNNVSYFTNIEAVLTRRSTAGGTVDNYRGFHSYGTANQFAVTTWRHLHVSNAAVANGGTVGTQYGLYIDNLTVGTTSYGIRVVGANNYSIYVDADPCYFGGYLWLAGELVVGSTTADGLIRQAQNDRFVVIAGGNSATAGAHLHLYGGSHSTYANNAYYDADVHYLRSQNAGTAYGTWGSSGLTIGSSAASDARLHVVSPADTTYRMTSEENLQPYPAGTQHLSTIEFEGLCLSKYNLGAKISVRQDGTWSTASTYYAPSAIEFYTQDQSTSDAMLSPRMTIDSVGRVGIGSLPLDGAQLTVHGTGSKLLITSDSETLDAELKLADSDALPDQCFRLVYDCNSSPATALVHIGDATRYCIFRKEDAANMSFSPGALGWNFLGNTTLRWAGIYGRQFYYSQAASDDAPTLYATATDAYLVFDFGDYIAYERDNNVLAIVIGNVPKLVFDPTSNYWAFSGDAVPGVPARTLGTNSLLWDAAYANTFYAAEPDDYRSKNTKDITFKISALSFVESTLSADSTDTADLSRFTLERYIDTANHFFIAPIPVPINANGTFQFLEVWVYLDDLAVGETAIVTIRKRDGTSETTSSTVVSWTVAPASSTWNGWLEVSTISPTTGSLNPLSPVTVEQDHSYSIEVFIQSAGGNVYLGGAKFVMRMNAVPIAWNF